MHNCDICHGDHPTERCRIINPLKWCEHCRKMTNHESNECYYRPGYNRGQNAAQTSNQANQVNQTYVTSQERARPVLGTQPAPPGTTPFRYVEDQGPSLEMVPVTPYNVEEPQQQPSYSEQPQDYSYEGSDQRISIDAQTLMMIARGDFSQTGGYNNNNNNRRPPPLNQN